jgi:SRSO17 transposase
MDFTSDFRSYFQLTTHNGSETARNYLAGLVMKASDKNMERMEEYIPDFNYENQQQFLSNSPWAHEPLVRRVGKEVSTLIGGLESALIIDECAFRKKGGKSVGVARQWNGRDGKVDNCQVGVFAGLSNGERSSLVNLRLYLPELWTLDAQRCKEAKIPESHREHRTKPELAWEMIQEAIDDKLDFGWIAFDSLYGSNPALLRKVDDAGRCFVADVRGNQRIYLEDPKVYLPRRKGGIGRKPQALKARSESETIEFCFEAIPWSEWEEVEVRDSTKGTIWLRACRRMVWLWDGEECCARRWWAVCVYDESADEWKFFLSNAGEKVSLETLVRKHAVRYWVERSFQDGKTSVGMGDYQARGWIAWHHHMALVMLAMLFMLKERKLQAQDHDLLSCQDIVELLNHFLPRADTTTEAIFENIERRHRKRRASIRSAKRRSVRAHGQDRAVLNLTK